MSQPQALTIEASAPVHEAPQTPGHVVIVDALRGFAALAVCLMHYMGEMLPKLKNGITHSLFFWGGQGVTVFFTISGFVIPYVLYRRGFTYRQFGTFIGKRFVRIDPPSYLSMGLTLAQWWAIDTFFHSPKRWLADVTAARLLHNVLYTVPFVADQAYWINGVFWTLSVEYQYYFTIALIFPLMLRGAGWLWGISAVVCLLPYPLRSIIIEHGGALADHRFFSQHAPVFWMGVLTAFSFVGLIPRKWYLTGLIVLTGLAFHQSYIRLTDVPVPDYLTPFLYPTMAVLTALLIRYAHFESRLTSFLGRISYSLYLTHAVVGTSLEVVLLKLRVPGSDAMKVAYQLACVAGAVGFATVFYHFVERPFVALSGRLFRR